MVGVSRNVLDVEVEVFVVSFLACIGFGFVVVVSTDDVVMAAFVVVAVGIVVDVVDVVDVVVVVVVVSIADVIVVVIDAILFCTGLQI